MTNSDNTVLFVDIESIRRLATEYVSYHMQNPESAIKWINKKKKNFTSIQETVFRKAVLKELQCRGFQI